MKYVWNVYIFKQINNEPADDAVKCYGCCCFMRFNMFFLNCLEIHLN